MVLCLCADFFFFQAIECSLLKADTSDSIRLPSSEKTSRERSQPIWMQSFQVSALDENRRIGFISDKLNATLR